MEVVASVAPSTRRTVAALIATATLLTPIWARGEDPAWPPKAELQARIVSLKARANSWLAAREELVSSVGLVSREKFWLLHHDMRSPGFRVRKDAQDRVRRLFDRFQADFPRRRRGRQIAEVQLVDATHAVVWNTWTKGRSGTTERRRTAWVWASEQGRGNWFLWGEEDGTWPPASTQRPALPAEEKVDPDPPHPGDAETDLAARLRRQTLRSFRFLSLDPTPSTLVIRYVPKVGRSRAEAKQHVAAGAVEIFRRLQRHPPSQAEVRIEWLMLWRDAYGRIERRPQWTATLQTKILTRIVWDNLAPEERIEILTWGTPLHPGWIHWPRDPSADASGAATTDGEATRVAPSERAPKLKVQPQTAKSLAAALRWLAAHQSPSGQWEAAGFEKWCDLKPATGMRPTGLGKAMFDPGVTGLAARAFLAAGYKPGGTHPHAQTLERALHYIRSIQDKDGCFGDRSGPNYIYNHGTCALAIVEAYGAGGGALLRRSAQRALDFIASARNPNSAWRYGVRPGDNDTSVSGWMALVLHKAGAINTQMRRAGNAARLVIDQGAAHGLQAWLTHVTDAKTGRVGYITRGSGPARPKELVDRFPGERSEAMTAVGVLIRAYQADTPSANSHVRKGAALISALPPIWNSRTGSIDMYYWYYATLAMREVGGRPWSAWKRALTNVVVPNQRKDGTPCDFQGSWDPIGPWGPDGGRVYATAILATTLASCAGK